MAFSPDPSRRGNPLEGDWIRIGEDHFQVVERCPCDAQSMHIRWFLQGADELASIRIPVEAVLAKEWDKRGDVAWWFGRRVALTDLRTSSRRLTETLRRPVRRLPSRLYYDGRPYRLLGKSRPSKDLSPDIVSVTVWEYVDKDETESLLVEIAQDGETLAYHGWYADPDDLSVAH